MNTPPPVFPVPSPVEFRGLGPETKGHAVQYEVVLDGDDVRISCHNLDMPVGAIPSRCGA